MNKFIYLSDFLFTVNKNEIIKQIWEDKSYIGYCKQVCTFGDLYNDLFQYMIIYLMEMPESKLIELHESGGLKMYIARIIYANGKNPTRQFLRQYRSECDIDYRSVSEPEELNDTEYIDAKVDIIRKGIKKEVEWCTSKGFYPASVKLLEIYSDCGSYREVSKRTGIPYKTVCRHINSLREKIINKK